MQRTTSDASSSLVLPPPCFRSKASSFTAPPPAAARCNNSSALSIQSSNDSFIMSSSWSPLSMATGAGAAGSTIIRSASSLSSPRPSSRDNIKFPLAPGRLDIAREMRTTSTGRPGSPGSVFSGRGTVDSMDSSTLTPTSKHPAEGLGYGCSRFLARLPPHPETLEFAQENEEKPQMELFRQDSWWKGDDKIKDALTQELKQMEEKMKELLREAPPSSPASKESTVKDWMRKLTTLRKGNHNKKEKALEAIARGSNEINVQLLQQIYDRLQAYNVAGSLETSGIPLEITQFITNNDLPCFPSEGAIGTDNSSSSQKTKKQKKKTPEHALTRKESCGDSQSPLLLLDGDQTLEDDGIASHFSKRQRGDRVRSMQKALFRPRSCPTELQGPQQRQDTESSIKISVPSPPPSPFAYWQQQHDAQSTASTPVWSNQLSQQEQRKQDADEEEEEKDNYNIPVAKQSSSIRQAADAVIEGILGWAATFDSTKQENNNGPLDSQQHGDTVVPVTVEPDWHAAFDSGKDLDPIIHIPPLPIQNGGGNEDRSDRTETGGTFSRTIGHEKFDTQDGKRSSPFQHFRSRSSSSAATRSVPHKWAGRVNNPHREDTRGSPSNDEDGSPFHFSRLNATTTSTSSCEPLNKDAVNISNSVEENGQRSSSPVLNVLNIKAILKPSATRKSSSRTGHVDKTSKAAAYSAERTMSSAYTCPLSIDPETDDAAKSESGLEKTMVSFGKDPSPLRHNRKKVRFMRRTAEKVISNEGVESESAASLGEIVDSFMVMTGCPAEPETEFDDYSIVSSEEDSTDGQGSGSIRTDGSLNESLASVDGIAATTQRPQSPVQIIGEALRTVLETPSKQEVTGTGLEAPLESKKSSSSTAAIRNVRILPNRLMRKVLGRNRSKKQARVADPELLQRVNTVEQLVNETLANLRETLSQKNEKTCDGSPHADEVTPPPEAREWKGEMDQNDSNDRRTLAVASTGPTILTKAEHSGEPFQEKQGGAKRKRRQKRNPENDDVEGKPQYNNVSGMPGCHCMCDTFGNTPSNRVPNQVVCDNKYLSHEELLAKKGRCSSDISRQTNDSLPETSDGEGRLYGTRSFRTATHQPKADDDGSQSDESVNQMVVEWLVDSLTFKNLLDQVVKTMGVKGNTQSPMFNLLLCASPPISPSTEDWDTTFSCCKADTDSTGEWDELHPMQEYENAPTTRWTAEPKIRCPPGYGRRDGGIGAIPSKNYKVKGKQASLRRQTSRRSRKASNH